MGLSQSPARSVLTELRSATAHHHQQLEELPFSRRLLRDDFRREEYRATLLHLFGFYEPVAALAAAHHTTWAPHIGMRVRDLMADLLDLDAAPSELRNAPRCTSLPVIDTVDRAFGCGYVIEGSALGGRLIVRHLRRTFAAGPPVPLRFFSGDGADTALRWRRFCAELEACTQHVDDVCRAGTATFTAMAAWVRQAVLDEAAAST